MEHRRGGRGGRDSRLSADCIAMRRENFSGGEGGEGGDGGDGEGEERSRAADSPSGLDCGPLLFRQPLAVSKSVCADLFVIVVSSL